MKTGGVRSHRDLDVWKHAHGIVLATYSCTGDFPRSELFGLSDQMRRSSISITSNIAEGFGRYSFKDKVRFWIIARGSLTELDNQLLIARDVGYLALERYTELAERLVRVHQMLNGLIRKARTAPE